MEDLIKTLVNAPTNSVLVLAGLAFLAVAIFGRISERLDPGSKGRLASGALGVVLLLAGLLLPSRGDHAGSDKTMSASSAPTSSNAASTNTTAAAEQTGSTGNVTSVSPSAGAYPIALTAGQVIKREGRTYTILKMQLDENDAKEFALDITARMMNEERYSSNFWNDNFRLVVDGVLRAPTGSLNEVVDANAAKEGVVKFAFPKDAKSVELQIDRFGADASGIAIALPRK
ncbi:MAG: hypothetical protein U1F33_08165 [Alphaproteobacteria bacterium]